MSQAAVFGGPRVGPYHPNVGYPQIDDSLDALLSQNSGTTAPAYAVEGTFWADTATAGFVTLKVYDGADWVSLFVLNKTANTIRMTDINAEVQVASASTANIGAAASENIEITGTTTITSFGTATAGTVRRLRFSSALTITHNGTSLICPSGSNILAVAGDSLVALSLGSGNWRVLGFTPATVTVSLAASRAVTSASSAGDRTLTAADAGKMIRLEGSANFTLTADAAATLGNGWAVDLVVTTSVVVTIDPNSSETIDGATTITLARGQTCRLVCTGSAFRTIGLSPTATLLQTALSSSVSAIECEIPPGFNAVRIKGQMITNLEQYQFLQLSNNGGSTWVSSSYNNVNQFSSSGSVSANTTGSSGLVVAYGGLTIPTHLDIFLALSDLSSGISMHANSHYWSSGLIGSRHNGFYNGTLTGTNRIRLVTGGGSYVSGTRLIVEGART